MEPVSLWAWAVLQAMMHVAGWRLPHWQSEGCSSLLWHACTQIYTRHLQELVVSPIDKGEETGVKINILYVAECSLNYFVLKYFKLSNNTSYKTRKV